MAWIAAIATPWLTALCTTDSENGVGPAAAGLTLRLTGFVSFKRFVVQRFAGPTCTRFQSNVTSKQVRSLREQAPITVLSNRLPARLPTPFSNNERTT